MEHSPFLKTLTETGSSVTADLVMVQNDSLESVICLGLHDSAVSCNQVIVSFVCISVTFQMCYCAYSVDEERLQWQVLGPRVLVSWFRNLEDTSLDSLPIDGFEPWVSSDSCPTSRTRNSRSTSVLSDSCGSGHHCDLNAAYAVEAAHHRQLLSVGSLPNSNDAAPRLCCSPLCHGWRRLHRRPCHSSNGSPFPVALEG